MTEEQVYFEELKRELLSAMQNHMNALDQLSYEQYIDDKAYDRYLLQRSVIVDKDLNLANYRYYLISKGK